LEGRHLLSNWDLILPFVPATQSTVLWTGTGAAGIEGAPQSTEVFQGKIFYNVTQAGGSNPTKVLAFYPGTSLATEVLAVSSGQFNALKAMNGALYMAHTSGRLWKYDGVSVTELTQTPFSSTEYVTAMAEFHGSMFFGTWRDRVWRSADATVFVDTMADERSEIPLGPPWPQSNPKPISDLAVWKGHLYGCNYECYNYSAKVFRSGDGADWVVPLTTSTYGYMGFVEDAPDRLYVASVENAGGASFKIRTSKDGLAWEDVWYTSSENKNLYGSPEYFSQTDRAYFPMMWYGSMSIAPVRDDPTGPGSSLIEPRLPTPRKFNSLIEVDGRLFAIGPLDPSADPNTSPYAISLIGNYWQTAGALGDFVWNDTNANGIQDSGEPSLAGVTVQLLNSTGSIVATTTTAADGRYQFSQLAPAQYRVQFVAPAGYVFSPQNQGTDDRLDSDADPTTGRTPLFTLQPGQTDTTWDAGMGASVAPGLLPSQGRIAFHSENWRQGDAKILIFEFTQTSRAVYSVPAIAAVTDARNPRFPPIPGRGDRLVFYGIDSGRSDYDIFLYDFSNQALTNLSKTARFLRGQAYEDETTVGLLNDRDAAMSPDGQGVVFTRGGALWLLNLKKMLARPLDFDPVAGKPGWEPSGPQFSSNGEWMTYWLGVDVNGDEVQDYQDVYALSTRALRWDDYSWDERNKVQWQAISQDPLVDTPDFKDYYPAFLDDNTLMFTRVVPNVGDDIYTLDLEVSASHIKPVGGPQPASFNRRQTDSDPWKDDSDPFPILGRSDVIGFSSNRLRSDGADGKYDLYVGKADVKEPQFLGVWTTNLDVNKTEREELGGSFTPMTNTVVHSNMSMSQVLRSHADLHVYDPKGRHLGVNYDTGTL